VHLGSDLEMPPGSTIRRATGLSSRYAPLIRAGTPTHLVHFPALAQIAGVEPSEGMAILNPHFPDEAAILNALGSIPI
jgi:hypothetical protein